MSPIVHRLKAIVVVHPVFAREKLQLRKAGGIAQQVIDIGVARKVARVENGGSLGVRLQLLVLVSVQPTEAELELMPSLGPRYIVLVLEALIAVLPREVARAPCHVQRRALQLNLRQAGADVVRYRKETGRSPTAQAAQMCRPDRRQA